MKIRIDQAKDIERLYACHDPDNSHRSLLKMLEILEIEYEMFTILKMKINENCINDDFIIRSDID
jgi:hypothetical protein